MSNKIIIYYNYLLIRQIFVSIFYYYLKVRNRFNFSYHKSYKIVNSDLIRSVRTDLENCSSNSFCTQTRFGKHA